MKIFIFSTAIFFITCLSSCSYNISMAHTEGMATDVIDDAASNTPDISPTVTIPMTPGSSIGIGK